MEQGAAKLAKILGFALLLGIAVTVFHPAYREAFLALVRGQPTESPIWKSNADYYPDIALQGPAAVPAAAPVAAEEPATP
ncbi:MAG: hypothetical protein EOL90_07200 [Spartobacteria bacterium]|nr:hypothetical protein [Spartobacteria bacterium]